MNKAGEDNLFFACHSRNVVGEDFSAAVFAALKTDADEFAPGQGLEIRGIAPEFLQLEGTAVRQFPTRVA